MNLKDLKEKLNPVINDLGYDLYDIEFTKIDKNSVLTIYIDRLEGIVIKDCVKVTEAINPVIDKLDPIKEEYFLEVSSAGAEKELRSIEAIKHNIGKFIYLETYEQKLEGYLESFNGEELGIKIKNKVTKINYEDVNHIRLAIKF